MIGAILGGVATIGSALMNNSGEYIDKAMRTLDQQEKNAENAYGYNQGKTRADISAALTSGQERMAKGIGQAAATQAVVGGNNAEIQRMKDTALEQAAEGGRQGATIAAQADTQAMQQLQQTKGQIAQSRAALYGQQAQSAASASGQAMKAGMEFATADLQAHLDKGKGLFESLFSKK